MPTVKKRKRILIVCQHFWPESFRINDIADFLANDKDCEVEVLCGLPNYPSGKLAPGYSLFSNRKQVHNSISIRRVLEIPRGNNSNIRIFLNYISFPFFSLFHIPRLLTKEYDHIFLYQLSPVMMSMTGLLVGKIKKIPTTMYVLDLWPENLYSVLDIQSPILRGIMAGISSWHYKRADRLIALSETMKNRLLEVTGKPAGDITVLPQACEKIYEQNVDDPQLSERFDKTFNIVYTGNISPAQSFETIVGAAKLLRDDGIVDINWIIVGDGMSRKWLEKEVEVAGLSDVFYFEGQKPVEDMPRYTTIADGLIGCLTKSELLEATIPAKVMSYIAAGKPLILAMDGEVQKLINTTIKCGYASETGNATELAANIKKLRALTAKQRKDMGERGRAYHFKHFERNLILNKLYSFIFN